MMRKEKKHTGIADGIGVIADTVAAKPLIEIYNYTRVLIENHCGILCYAREKVQIRMRHGSLCVCGENLELKRISREQLVVTGAIHGVSLQRSVNAKN